MCEGEEDDSSRIGGQQRSRALAHLLSGGGPAARLSAGERGQSLDYGSGVFAFSIERPLDGKPATGGNGTHIAFEARRRSDVDAFHREGLAHGGRDAGAPGLRPEYDANYYGAFLFDPDGNKIEAVTFSAI